MVALRTDHVLELRRARARGWLDLHRRGKARRQCRARGTHPSDQVNRSARSRIARCWCVVAAAMTVLVAACSDDEGASTTPATSATGGATTTRTNTQPQSPTASAVTTGVPATPATTGAPPVFGNPVVALQRVAEVA